MRSISIASGRPGQVLSVAELAAAGVRRVSIAGEFSLSPEL